MLDIKVTKTDCPKQKPTDKDQLGFGKIFVNFVQNEPGGIRGNFQKSQQ